MFNANINNIFYSVTSLTKNYLPQIIFYGYIPYCWLLSLTSNKNQPQCNIMIISPCSHRITIRVHDDPHQPSINQWTINRIFINQVIRWINLGPYHPSINLLMVNQLTLIGSWTWLIDLINQLTCWWVHVSINLWFIIHPQVINQQIEPLMGYHWVYHPLSVNHQTNHPSTHETQAGAPPAPPVWSRSPRGCRRRCCPAPPGLTLRSSRAGTAPPWPCATGEARSGDELDWLRGWIG